MTKFEDAMNTVRSMVNGLCYTKSYTVSKFDTSVMPTGDTRVDFEIERHEKLGKDTYVTHQNGTVYVTQKGKIYHLDFTGNPKPVKNIGGIVTGFY